ELHAVAGEVLADAAAEHVVGDAGEQPGGHPEPGERHRHVGGAPAGRGLEVVADGRRDHVVQRLAREGDDPVLCRADRQPPSPQSRSEPASLSSTPSWIRARPFGAKVRSKKPPIPPAPFQLLSTVTTLRSGPAGVTVQVVTMLELASFSTIRSSPGVVTSISWSRTRLLVACSSQCTRVPSPWPPASTR